MVLAQPWGAGCWDALELVLEELSSFMLHSQHTPSSHPFCGVWKGPETPNQDSFSMEAAPWQDARPGGALVPRAGGPQAVSVQKPPCDGCSDIPRLLQSRSRAASQGPWPAGAAALPCWAHSSSGWAGGMQEWVSASTYRALSKNAAG